MNAVVFGNNIEGAGFAGIYLAANAAADANVLVVGNRVDRPAGFDGIVASATSGGTLRMHAGGNVITQPAGSGFHFTSDDGSLVDATVKNNRVLETGNGLFVDCISGLSPGEVRLEASRNLFVMQSGTAFSLSNSGILDATLRGNTVIGFADGGVFLSSFLDTTLTVTGNTIALQGLPFTSGIALQAIGGTLDATITGNSISQPGEAGVVALAVSTSMTSLLIEGNTTTASTGYGLAVIARDDSTLDSTLRDNLVLGTVLDGIWLGGDSTQALDVTLDRNRVLSFGGHGIAAILTGTGTLNVQSTAPLPGFNNVIGAPQAGFLRYDADGGPTGIIRINGLNHDAGTDLP
jgi:hypothetical protein